MSFRRQPASALVLWAVFLAAAIIAVAVESMPQKNAADIFNRWGLSAESLREGRWWTLFSYGLLHGAWWHALINLVAFRCLAFPTAAVRGTLPVLALLCLGVVAGGLAQVLARPETTLVGMSGGLFALAVAACLAWDPDDVALRIGRWRLARLRGRSLGYGFLGGALVLWAASALSGNPGIMADECHAVGAIVGLLWYLLFWRTPHYSLTHR